MANLYVPTANSYSTTTNKTANVLSAAHKLLDKIDWELLVAFLLFSHRITSGSSGTNACSRAACAPNNNGSSVHGPAYSTPDGRSHASLETFHRLDYYSNGGGRVLLKVADLAGPLDKPFETRWRRHSTLL